MASIQPLSFLTRSETGRPNEDNRAYLLAVRFVAVFFVLSVSLAIGFFISDAVMLVFLSLVSGVAAYLLMARLPWVVFAVFLAGSFILRAPFGLGSIAVLPVSYLIIASLTGLWVLEKGLIRRRLVLQRHRVMAAAMTFAGISTLAFIAGFLPWFPVEGAQIDVQLAQLGLFILSVCAFLLAAHTLEKPAHLQRLILVFLVMVAAYILFSQLPAFRGMLFRVFNYGARGSMMWLWAAALAFSQAIANHTLKLRWRVLLLVFVGLLFYATFIQSRSWVSGWGPALVAVAVIIWFHFKRYRVVMILAGLGVVIAMLDSSLWRRLVLENAYSIATRSAAGSILLEIVKVNPVLGLGPANYYWYTPLFPILGWYVEFNSHNQYVDIVAQTGILGMIAFIWLLAEILFAAIREARPENGAFHNAYALGVIGGVAGMAVAGVLGDWVIPFVYNVGVDGANASLPGWFFLGGLFALKAYARVKDTGTGESA